MSVFDETWRVLRGLGHMWRVAIVREPAERESLGEWRTNADIDEPTMTADDAARMTLTSAAPELLRALAAVEWSATHIFNNETSFAPACPECHGVAPLAWYEQINGHFGHESGCALSAALKKARGET